MANLTIRFTWRLAVSLAILIIASTAMPTGGGQQSALLAATSGSPTSLPSESPSPYPSPMFTELSNNSWIYIVSDDKPIIEQAQRQASMVGNQSPPPSLSPSPSATPTATLDPNVIKAKKTAVDARSTASALLQKAKNSATSDLMKENVTNAIAADAEAVEAESKLTKAKPDTSTTPAPTSSPPETPSPGVLASDVSGAVLNTIVSLNNDLQADLVEQFKRRDIPVINQVQFADYCVHGNNAIALHWSVVDPSLRLDQSWDLFGYTSSTLELYWHLTSCDPQQEIALSAKVPYSTYHTTAGKNYQVRAPTDFLATVFGLLALIHPAGRALVSIGVTGGISAVSGSLNTI